MKLTIYCGTDQIMTEKERTEFINMMSENGKYNVVFCQDDSIPKLIQEYSKIVKP